MPNKGPNKLVYAAIAVVHGTVATLTWRDINRRPAMQVRGPKNVWRIASALNTLGSVAYWVFGRRPAVSLRAVEDRQQ